MVLHSNIITKEINVTCKYWFGFSFISTNNFAPLKVEVLISKYFKRSSLKKKREYLCPKYINGIFEMIEGRSN